MSINLEQSKKRAKDLKKDLSRGSTTAAVRVQRSLPDCAASSIETITSQGLKLSAAQFIVAREAGYGSWPKLRQAVEIATMSRDESERTLVQAAVAGDDSRVHEILALHPELANQSAACALCLANPAVRELVEEIRINKAIGPLGWPSLIYLCSSRFGVADTDTRSRRIELAHYLIRCGADASAGVPEMDTVRGYRTVLGAAIGLAGSPEIVRLLLQAGADINDGPSLYEGSAMWVAVRKQDRQSLALLLDADPPQWHKCHALPQAFQFDDPEMVEMLLDSGADPNWNKGTWGFDGNYLHEAVVLNVEPSIVQSLLAAGALVDFSDRDGRTPLQLAVCLNRHGLATLLLEAGADEQRVTDEDRAIGQCFEGGQTAQLEAVELRAIDHLWLCRALRWGNDEAADCLLRAGADANAVDDDGMRALHLAAQNGNAALCEKLLAAGAEAQAVNYAGQTALDIALIADSADLVVAALTKKYRGEAIKALPDPDLSDIFEAAADAVVSGDAEGLQAMLVEHPELARARSSRPHRCTLFNYLGANGFETERQKTPANALEMIDILIAAGSDPNARCYTYRGGPSNNTIGLLTSGDHPRRAGLTLAMTSAMVAAGAEVDGLYQLLIEAYDAVNDGRPLVIQDNELAGRTMIEAAMMGEQKLVAAFVDAGVDVDAVTNTNTTALHQAAINGYRNLVQLLLDAGADPLLRDSTFDGNAAGWANAGGHEDLRDLLLQVIQAREDDQ